MVNPSLAYREDGNLDHICERADEFQEHRSLLTSVLTKGKGYHQESLTNYSLLDSEPRYWISPTILQHFCLPLKRYFCFRVRNILFYSSLAFLLVSIINGIVRPSYSSPPQHYKKVEQRIQTSSVTGRGNPNYEKVFIAANIINEDLIRGSWGRSLLSLIDLLGDENVFVSIYENDSGNGTSAALRDLHEQLACNSSVVTGDHLPLSTFPTVILPNGEERVQRITYLAEVRNRLLRPLDSTYVPEEGSGFMSAANTSFDKILFLNDVYFDPLDAVQLLFSTNANNGEAQYRAACAVDFIRGAQFYDTFVVRDTEGYSPGFMLYPWFAPVGSATSRNAVLSQTDAVPVRSCWGGMAAFNASLFQTRDASAPFSSRQDYSLLKFRSSREPFWEAAECCLIFADLEEQYGLPEAADHTGVYLNPYIRVAYSKTTWNWLPVLRRFEQGFQYLQYALSMFAYPEFNPRRLHEPGDVVAETVWQPALPSANDSHGHFVNMHRTAAPGGFCGQRKMFVMKQDLEDANTNGAGKNWAKVEAP